LVSNIPTAIKPDKYPPGLLQSSQRERDNMAPRGIQCGDELQDEFENVAIVVH